MTATVQKVNRLTIEPTRTTSLFQNNVWNPLCQAIFIFIAILFLLKTSFNVNRRDNGDGWNVVDSIFRAHLLCKVIQNSPDVALIEWNSSGFFITFYETLPIIPHQTNKDSPARKLLEM